MKFKVGDKVKVGRRCSGCKTGIEYTLEMGMDNKFKARNSDMTKHDGCYCKDNWIKIGGDMDLRKRIEALDNGWDKKADDILEVMNEVFIEDRMHYRISVPTRNDDHTSGVKIFEGDDEKLAFRYKDQCSKMTAFKEALLWLLDKSGLDSHKKGDTIKIESDGQTYKVKVLEKL